MNEEFPLLPVFMKMTNRPCLVVGAGLIGWAKIQNLLDCGAIVNVVAPFVCEQVEQLADENKIALTRKLYDQTDLGSVSVVIAATSDPALNHRVFDEAVARGCLANVVDDPDYCDFYFGSIVRRGALQVAISTTGESPAFAQQLRQEIDDALPSDTGEWLAQLGELRRQVNRAIEPGPQRVSMLRELARREACHEKNCPCRALGAVQELMTNS